MWQGRHRISGLTWRAGLFRAFLFCVWSRTPLIACHSPALISYGSHLGLVEIDQEDSANDGRAPDLLKKENPSILGAGTIIHAVDGLQFETRDALYVFFSSPFPPYQFPL